MTRRGNLWYIEYMADPVIIKIDDDTWRIENDGVRFFLLKGKKKALLMMPFIPVISETPDSFP